MMMVIDPYRFKNQEYFFDSFPVQPTALFACRRMTGNAGDIAFEIGDQGGINLYWNDDGSLTGSSPTDNLTYPTLDDIITSSNGDSRIEKFYEQMSGGTDYAIYTSNNNAMRLQLDANGNAYIVSNSSGIFETVTSYNLLQPITVIQHIQFDSGNSSFKTAWEFRDANGNITARHQSIRFGFGGGIRFGVLRWISGEDIHTNPTIVQSEGNGANSAIYIDNVNVFSGDLGSNGNDSELRFGTSAMDFFSEFIVFDSILSTQERSDLYNELSAYY